LLQSYGIGLDNTKDFLKKVNGGGGEDLKNTGLDLDGGGGGGGGGLVGGGWFLYSPKTTNQYRGYRVWGKKGSGGV